MLSSMRLKKNHQDPWARLPVIVAFQDDLIKKYTGDDFTFINKSLSLHS
jgi:hypothetical protein